MQALTEKLQLFADMAEAVGGLEDLASRSRLLLRGDASDLQQGEALLKGAITEGRRVLHEMCIQLGCRDMAPELILNFGLGFYQFYYRAYALCNFELNE